MHKIKDKMTKSPTFIEFLRMRDKLAQLTLTALVALFDAISPVWNFQFIKKPGEKNNRPKSYEVI